MLNSKYYVINTFFLEFDTYYVSIENINLEYFWIQFNIFYFSAIKKNVNILDFLKQYTTKNISFMKEKNINKYWTILINWKIDFSFHKKKSFHLLQYQLSITLINTLNLRHYKNYFKIKRYFETNFSKYELYNKWVALFFPTIDIACTTIIIKSIIWFFDFFKLIALFFW